MPSSFLVFSFFLSRRRHRWWCRRRRRHHCHRFDSLCCCCCRGNLLLLVVDLTSSRMVALHLHKYHRLIDWLKWLDVDDIDIFCICIRRTSYEGRVYILFINGCEMSSSTYNNRSSEWVRGCHSQIDRITTLQIRYDDMHLSPPWSNLNNVNLAIDKMCTCVRDQCVLTHSPASRPLPMLLFVCSYTILYIFIRHCGGGGGGGGTLIICSFFFFASLCDSHLSSSSSSSLQPLIIRQWVRRPYCRSYCCCCAWSTAQCPNTNTRKSITINWILNFCCCCCCCCCCSCQFRVNEDLMNLNLNLNGRESWSMTFNPST